MSAEVAGGGQGPAALRAEVGPGGARVPQTSAVGAELPPEPVFLSRGFVVRCRTLIHDFVNFTLILVFYLGCWAFAAPAFLIDNMFGTSLFERFIRFIEFLDE